MFCDALIFQVYLAQNMTCIVIEHETIIMKYSSAILYDSDKLLNELDS